MEPMNVCPILLAAGQSRRFGGDKLIHPLEYKKQIKPLILHSIAPWLDVFSQLNVIVREDNTALQEILHQSEFTTRINTISAVNPSKGMSASLVTGIKATSNADAWLIGLADMPFINKQVISNSFSALKNGAILTQSEYGHVRGHPVGFTSRFLADLLGLEGDIGAKKILESNSELITAIQSPDDGVISDIDKKSQI
jgi:molybdenum cofactor cytidylyltransferase